MKYDIIVNGRHVEEIDVRSERRAIVEAEAYVTNKNTVGLVIGVGKENKIIAYWDRGKRTK